MTEAEPASRLGAVLDRLGPLAIAVSGGVDSMTLATFAHRRSPQSVTVVHAVSPAVPAEATGRVRSLAETEGWTLIATAAGEFDDPRYRENPADRCYFCKTNLYGRVRALTEHRIASGANLDDLGDYRPGLLAAAESEVVHPLIEARMTKSDVRALARSLGLGGIAELPAQPCLSSRVETGIAIDAGDLAFIEKAERLLADEAPQGATLRCRITREGVLFEFGDDCADHSAHLTTLVAGLCDAADRPFAGSRPYRRGSMFIRS